MLKPCYLVKMMQYGPFGHQNLCELAVGCLQGLICQARTGGGSFGALMAVHAGPCSIRAGRANYELARAPHCFVTQTQERNLTKTDIDSHSANSMGHCELV